MAVFGNSMMVFNKKSIIPFDKLLDLYPNAASALSLKKIKSDYNGFCLRVRRLSDDLTQDIGFVDNSLDVFALESFCSGTDGVVSIWYDQSGNERNATQDLFSRSPKIVDNGSVILKDSLPAISSDGVNHTMDLAPENNIFNTSFSVFSTFSYTVKTAQQRLYGYGKSFRVGYILRFISPNIQFFAAQSNGASNAVIVSVPEPSTEQRIVVTHIGIEDAFVRGKTNESNLESLPMANFTSDSFEGWKIFTSRRGFNPIESLTQQIVFYDSDQTDNVSNIETIIKSEFNIE